MNEIKLSNGVLMPQMGYGVYQIEPEDCERCVMDAISVGYRMIDTAQAYLNEEAVGKHGRKAESDVKTSFSSIRCGTLTTARDRP